MDYASSPHDFKLMLAAGGQRASGIEQLDRGAGGRREGEAEQQPDGPGRARRVLVVVAAFMFLDNRAAAKKAKKRRRPKRRSRSPAPTPAAPPPARRRAKRSKARWKARSKRLGGSARPPIAASIPTPPLPAPVAAAYDAGKTVVLLVVHDGGIDDRLVAAASARRLRRVPGVAVFVVPAKQIARYAAITARRSTSSRCRRWS